MAERAGDAPLPFVLAVNPKQFSGAGIERDDRASRTRRGIQNAVDHQRRPFEFVFGAVAEIIGLYAPRDFEIAEVRCINLIQRTIARSGKIGGIGWPIAVLRL